MGNRERMKDATKQALRDALERLAEGKPTNTELKQKAKKGTLKINKLSVEKEAGTSVGALRNHGDVADEIKDKALSIRAEQSGQLSNEEFLEKELGEVKAEKTQLQKKKDEHYKQRKIAENAQAKDAARHLEIIQSLMRMIPLHEREKAMHTLVNTTADNIIKGKFDK